MNKGNGKMKNGKTGRYLLLAGLVVILAGVGYLNYAIGTDTGTPQAAETSPESEIEGALSIDDLAVMSSQNYFYDYKANRKTCVRQRWRILTAS